MPEGSTRFLSTITSSASKQFAGAMLFSYGGNILTGNHSAEALAGAAVSSLMTVYAPALMWGSAVAQLGTALGAATMNLQRNRYADFITAHQRNFGGSYSDTQQAYTMRQQAQQLSQQTGVHIQQILGNEASLMHR